MLGIEEALQLRDAVRIRMLSQDPTKSRLPDGVRSLGRQCLKVFAHLVAVSCDEHLAPRL